MALLDKRNFPLIVTALLITGAVFFAVRINYGLKGSHILEIRDSESGRRYGSWHLEEGSEFAIEFIHSVNQSPVMETYTIEEKMIRLKKMSFYSFGAGMPSHQEEGMLISRDGDAMVISGYNSSFRELNLIVGTVSDHLLYINDEIISLRELCGRNAHITIRSK